MIIIIVIIIIIIHLKLYKCVQCIYITQGYLRDKIICIK